MQSNINNPDHYTQGNVETISVIRDVLTEEEFNGFVVGNIIKYISRYKYKGGVEDLKKAQWYLSKFIDCCEDRKE